MAWIDRGPHYEWDVPYPQWSDAADHAEGLAQEYKIFTQVLHHPEEETFIVTTQNTITEAHSIACRCDVCVLF